MTGKILRFSNTCVATDAEDPCGDGHLVGGTCAPYKSHRIYRTNRVANYVIDETNASDDNDANSEEHAPCWEILCADSRLATILCDALNSGAIALTAEYITECNRADETERRDREREESRL